MAHLTLFWELRGMAYSQPSLFLFGIAKDVFVSMIHLTHSAEGFPGKPSLSGRIMQKRCLLLWDGGQHSSVL